MSDDIDQSMLVIRPRWFSVNIRFFAPVIASDCFVVGATIPAVDEKDALESARAIFERHHYHQPTGIWHMFGTPIDPPWAYDAKEIPEKYVAQLDAEELAFAHEAEKAASAEAKKEKKPGSVLPFKKKDPPPDLPNK